MSAPKISGFDRALVAIAPGWARRRLQNRLAANLMLRHYEAAGVGRRTENWRRSATDANAANGPSLTNLRALARDLARNNPWARRGLRVIGANSVGWGIAPKPVGADAVSGRARSLWKKWAETTECDAEGRLTFAGIQRQAIETVAQDGEILIRRRPRLAADGLSIPMQLQLLEADFVDTLKDGIKGQAGGPIIQGIEYDAIGRRAAYWLFEQHPGSNRIGVTLASKRYAAEDVVHVYRPERPGQVRGVSWFAPVLVRLKEFDEFEDAVLMKQKIAACFSGWIRDVDGSGSPLGETSKTDPTVEMLEPGTMTRLAPGQDVTFGTPPSAGEEGFTVRSLRSIAAGLGVTFEDMTGDYSHVNFSSARMARIAHWAQVYDWQWNMLIPQLCDPVWAWAMNAAEIAGEIPEAPGAEWTPPPMPILEPDREGLAFARLVRGGARTPSEIVREQGRDWQGFIEEYKRDLADLDAAGIWLDSDVRRVSSAGLTQERTGGSDPALAGSK